MLKLDSIIFGTSFDKHLRSPIVWLCRYEMDNCGAGKSFEVERQI